MHRKSDKAWAAAMLAIAIAATVALPGLQGRLRTSRLDPASRALSPPARLELQIPATAISLQDRARMIVSVTNVWRDPFYITTNTDPFVSGSGLLRNFYFTISGDCNPRQVARATLNFGFGGFSEQELLNVGAIALLRPGAKYSAELPLDAWSSLVSRGGRCWVQAHYRGEAAPGRFTHPFLRQSLHSNFVRVELSE